MPWEASEYAKRHVGRVVWGPDPDACAHWVALRAAHLQHAARQRELDGRAYELARSVAQQWTARKTVELHEQFHAEVPDADWWEWERHLADHGPEWEWSDSHHHPYGDLGEVVRFLVGRDIDPTGLTAQQALDTAREHGLPDTWAGLRRSTNQFPQRFPDEWADLVIGAQPVALPQPIFGPDGVTVIGETPQLDDQQFSVEIQHLDDFLREWRRQGGLRFLGRAEAEAAYTAALASHLAPYAHLPRPEDADAQRATMEWELHWYRWFVFGQIREAVSWVRFGRPAAPTTPLLRPTTTTSRR